MTSTSRPDTFTVDGEVFAMSLAWRLSLRRRYRAARRTGWGPMGAREQFEAELFGRQQQGLRQLAADLERLPDGGDGGEHN